MPGTFARLLRAAGVAAAIATATLTVGGPMAGVVRADEEPRRIYSDMRLGLGVTTRVRPDPKAPEAVGLPPGSLISLVTRQIGADGAEWQLIGNPNGEPVGWLPLEVVLYVGIPTNDVPGYRYQYQVPDVPLSPYFGFY
ncbi:MAG: hypothetical protein U0531_00895 [Dehalococcoidia bacterium]